MSYYPLSPQQDVQRTREADYADADAFAVALSQMAERQKLNMSPEWASIIQALWDNDRCCTCQTGKVRCPCPHGVMAAAAGGECHCGLFVGH